jgi:hypothetical protein
MQGVVDRAVGDPVGPDAHVHGRLLSSRACRLTVRLAPPRAKRAVAAAGGLAGLSPWLFT